MVAHTQNVILRAENLTVRYGSYCALKNVCLSIPDKQVTGFMGSSGCGKSTALRCFNRMNELLRGVALEGKVYFGGYDIYHRHFDPIMLRRTIGMVFQRPNPFWKSIYENVAFPLRVNGVKKRPELDDRVEQALKRANLWDEVKNKLKQGAQSLSGGQQQRLCIARAIACDPRVLLMDEPCSALDPYSTRKVEELILELRRDRCVVLVTHNLQQARRVTDNTAFFNVRHAEKAHHGYLVEFGETREIFERPQHKETQDYVLGRFG